MTTRPRTVKVRQLVVLVMGVAVLGLGAGPVRATFVDAEPTRVGGPATTAPAEETARRVETRRFGVWDTTAVRGRSLPEPELLTPEQARDTPPDPGTYVVVTGTLTGTVGPRALPGVGVLVTWRDRERVASLGGVPAGLEVLQQLRPRDLVALDLDPTPAQGRAGTVDAVVRTEIAPRITSSSGLLAGRVVSDTTGPGLLLPRGDGLAVTPRGRAYLVAARAVPSGSRTVPVATRAAGVSVLAFAHGEDAGSLLVHNAGEPRDLVIDLLVGETVQRFDLRVAARSLTTMVLPASSPAGTD